MKYVYFRDERSKNFSLNDKLQRIKKNLVLAAHLTLKFFFSLAAARRSFHGFKFEVITVIITGNEGVIFSIRRMSSRFVVFFLTRAVGPKLFWCADNLKYFSAQRSTKYWHV